MSKKESNADIMARFIGEEIASVESTNSGKWYDPDGFVIKFNSGKKLEVDADAAQGVGYLTLEQLS